MSVERMRARWLWVCLMAAGWAVAGSTNSCAADDLVGMFRLAEQRDSEFEAARHALEASRQKMPQALAGLLPSVSINGNNGKQKGQASFSEAPYVDREVANWGWTLQLTQPLFRWGSWVAYAQADAQVKQAVEQFRLAEQDLILRLAQAYFDVLVALQSIDVADAQVKAVDEQLTLATRNFAVGTATITDIHEAKSRSDLSRAQQVAATNEMENKCAELEKIVGEFPLALKSFPRDFSLPSPQPFNVQEWITVARQRHPQVLIQEAAYEVAEQEIAKSRAAHLPSVDLVASHGKNFSSGSVSSPADISTRTRVSQVGLQVSIPLYSGGGINARVSEAIANRDKTRADLETAKRQAATQARQAFSGVVNGIAQVDALRSAVESSKSSVEANRIGYKIGTRINIDVLNAEQQLYAAERDLFKARSETLLQGLRLKAAAGTLEPADLESINGLLAGRIVPISFAALAQRASMK